MKRVISTILVCVLLLGCVLSLASCGKMFSGTYQADIAIAKLTCEFKFGGKVTVTVDPLVGDTTSYEGKYEINKDTQEITFVFENADDNLITNYFHGTQKFSQGEKDGTKFIEIGGVTYTEVK